MAKKQVGAAPSNSADTINKAYFDTYVGSKVVVGNTYADVTPQPVGTLVISKTGT